MNSPHLEADSSTHERLNLHETHARYPIDDKENPDVNAPLANDRPSPGINATASSVPADLVHNQVAPYLYLGIQCIAISYGGTSKQELASLKQASDVVKTETETRPTASSPS